MHNRHIPLMLMLSLLLTLVSLVGRDLLGRGLILGLGLVVWSALYFVERSHGSGETALTALIMLSIPLSFTDVFGYLKGGSLLCWFYLFIIFLTANYFLKGLAHNDLKLNALSVTAILVIVVAVIPLLNSPDFVDGLKQYGNIFLSLASIAVGNLLKPRLSQKDKFMLRLYFVLGSVVAAIGVLIQMTLYFLFGQVTGYMRILGSARYAFGFLFMDFSFLSLYLATGCMMAFTLTRVWPEQRLRLWGAMALLLIASVSTSARTGFAAFIVVFLGYNVLRLLRNMPRNPTRSLIILLATPLVSWAGYKLLLFFRPAGFTYDSGRSSLNSQALSIFGQNIWTGVGLGGGTYYERFGTIPHNLIFQSLAQGGLLFTVPMIGFLLALLLSCFRRDQDLFWVLGTVIVGSMFIPNIFDSRFLIAVFLAMGASL